MLDLDRPTLKAEAERLAAVDGGGPTVEIIDRATWITLCRLQATGMIQIMGGVPRVLHRAAGLADTDAEDAANALNVRLAAIRGEAQRALRMAQVLAAGGFPEEAMPLLGKAIQHGAAAILATRGGLSAGVTTANTAQISDLINSKALLGLTAATLEAITSAPSAAAGIDQLLKVTGEVLAVCCESVTASE